MVKYFPCNCKGGFKNSFLENRPLCFYSCKKDYNGQKKKGKKNSGYFLGGEQQQEQFKIKITKDALTLELKMK